MRFTIGYELTLTLAHSVLCCCVSAPWTVLESGDVQDCEAFPMRMDHHSEDDKSRDCEDVFNSASAMPNGRISRRANCRRFFI